MSSIKGGFPILLGQGNDVFIIDWSLKLRRPTQARGLRVKDFVSYWCETYPHWAKDLPQVLWRIKYKGVNLSGHNVKADVIRNNTAGPDGSSLTEAELAIAYAPIVPPQADPWGGLIIEPPVLCCGDDPFIG